MAIVFQDSFDFYGIGSLADRSAALRMLQGRWAQMGSTGGNEGDVAWPETPSFGARTGVSALRISPSSSGADSHPARVILPSTYAEIYVHQALYRVAQPLANNEQEILGLRDSSNAIVGRFLWQADGSIVYKRADGTQMAASGPLALISGSWQSVQFHAKMSATVGVIEVKVNNVSVLNATGLNVGAVNIAQLRWVSATVTDADSFYIDDLVVNDTSGTRNNGWPGEVRVATLYPRADDETGWTARRRTMTGNGQLGPLTGSMGLSCADNVQFELGSGDYTLETFCKLEALPTGSNQATLFGKWRESTNERSYQLFLGGPSLNNSHLQFSISTDGTAGTVIDVCDAEWSPVLYRDYHIVVQRSSGVTVMFVDGVPLNAPAADANTYHDNAAVFMVGAQQSGVGSVVANTGINGFLDEVRVTKGVARYGNTGFAVPSVPFGRNVGADADFNSVSLLLGFDTSITDESSFGRAVTSVAGAARFANDDQAPGAYKTVNNTIPRDDSFVEAPYVAAANVLTASANFGNNETVVVDSVTYTFKTVFVDVAGNVLIGATTSDSIDNLAAAINGDAGAGTLYGTGTTASTNASALNIDNDQMRVTANTPGTAGNSIGSTETCANAAWSSGTTLAGGLDIPGPSSFLLTRLPAQTTGVKAITLVQRAMKTDAGDGTTQLSFVTADNSSENGDDHALSTSYAYYSDEIDTDPSTSGGLTPSSFIGARVRVDRTA